MDEPARSGVVSAGRLNVPGTLGLPVTTQDRQRALFPPVPVPEGAALTFWKAAALAPRVVRMAVALGACLAAGCGGTQASHPASAPPAAAPPPAASPTSGDPQARILGAYTGMWHAYAVAARTADYQPGALSRYTAGDALMVLTRSLYGDHQHGVVLRGAPALHPRVTSMTPAASPDLSSVRDCASDSRWRQYTTSGRPASGAPAGRHRIYAQLRLFGPEWKVIYLAVEKAGTC